MIQKNDIKFVNPTNFDKELQTNKKQRKLLLTIDDGYQSFYDNAWPILKKSKIPFILFISNKRSWKSWIYELEKIREIERYDFVEIGNHSYTHDYLIDFTEDKIRRFKIY